MIKIPVFLLPDSLNSALKPLHFCQTVQSSAWGYRDDSLRMIRWPLQGGAIGGFGEDLVFHGNVTGRRKLTTPNSPTDEVAALVCAVARLRDLDIPQELAILGAGDSRAGRNADPPVSSFPLPAKSVGYAGMKTLHAMLQGVTLTPEQRNIRIHVAPIIERASTKLSGHDKSLARARDMILSKACSGITINEVVAKVPMCRMTFHNRYKATFGCTPGEDLRQARLEAAQRLLTSSEMSVTQVAHACGFDEPNKFYVFFKRETGMSPSAWRKEGKDGSPAIHTRCISPIPDS